MKYFCLLLACFVFSGCASIESSPSEDNSKDYLALKEQADKAYNKKNYDVAIKKYLLITKGVARDADSWFKLGNIYARTHRPEQAINAYKESVLRSSDLSKAWHNMGLVYMRQAANAYLSLQKFSKPDDPILELSIHRLNGLYELMPTPVQTEVKAAPVIPAETEIVE